MFPPKGKAPVKGKKKPPVKKGAAKKPPMPPAMAAIGNQMMKGC